MKAAALARKEADKLAQEKREAKRVLQYNEHLKYPVYHTKDELAVVLRNAHESIGAAMYSTAMQVEIVRTQINVRKFVYGASLEKGALLSKLRDGNPVKLQLLRSRLHRFFEAEIEKPLKLKPPTIRATFKKALNPTKQRTALDNERNEEAARMTTEFYETFEAGIFSGWRCLYDYGRGHPTNPEALVGLLVTKDFNEHGLHCGTISHFKKPWWRVTYEDGEFEDLNFKQLANLETPPSFSELQYAPLEDTSTACNDFLATAPLKGGGFQGMLFFLSPVKPGN